MGKMGIQCGTAGEQIRMYLGSLSKKGIDFGYLASNWLFSLVSAKKYRMSHKRQKLN